MLRTREKILEQKLKRGLNDLVINRINKRLNLLKKESPWSVNYRWNKKAEKLFVKTYVLGWDISFQDRCVTVFAEGPIFLKPILSPAKKKLIEILREEIKSLSI